MVGETGGWWSASEEVDVRERVETEDGVVRMLKCDDCVEDPDEYDDEEGPKPKPYAEGFVLWCQLSIIAGRLWGKRLGEVRGRMRSYIGRRKLSQVDRR